MRFLWCSGSSSLLRLLDIQTILDNFITLPLHNDASSVGPVNIAKRNNDYREYFQKLLHGKW